MCTAPLLNAPCCLLCPQRDIVEFRNSEVAKSKADADQLQESLDKLGDEVARWGAGRQAGLACCSRHA